jgi:hypothetical protein
MATANGSGTWTRWVLTGVIVAIIAVAGAVGANLSKNAAQDVHISNIGDGLDRIEKKLDRLLEMP